MRRPELTPARGRSPHADQADATSRGSIGGSRLRGNVTHRRRRRPRAGPKPTREKVQVALESLRKFDLGGLEITYGPDDHTGLDFADLSIIGTDGKFRR